MIRRLIVEFDGTVPQSTITAVTLQAAADLRGQHPYGNRDQPEHVAQLAAIRLAEFVSHPQMTIPRKSVALVFCR